MISEVILRRLEYFEYLVAPLRIHMIRSHHLMINFATLHRRCCLPIVAAFILLIAVFHVVPVLNDHEDEEAEDNQIDDKYLLGFSFKIYYTDRELSIDFTCRENCNQQ